VLSASGCGWSEGEVAAAENVGRGETIGGSTGCLVRG
jgi:hypothetical protein